MTTPLSPEYYCDNFFTPHEDEVDTDEKWDNFYTENPELQTEIGGGLGMTDIDLDMSGTTYEIMLFHLWNNLCGYYNLNTKRCVVSHIHNWECEMMEQYLRQHG